MINLYRSIISPLGSCFCLLAVDANDIMLLGILDKLADIDPVTRIKNMCTVSGFEIYKFGKICRTPQFEKENFRRVAGENF